jgi:uncharacterized membrane protein
MISPLIAAFGLGLVAGSRALLAPAALFLTRGGIAGYILAVLSLAELVGDKLPQTPPRTSLPPLIMRILSGAVVGWFLCAFYGGSAYAGALLGIVGALIGTYGGKALRLWLIARTGAIPAALAEDAVAIVLAAVLMTAVVK